MRILVTGGAGFIGHNVVSQLEKHGHECIIIDNLTTYGVLSSDELERLHVERKTHYKSPLYQYDIQTPNVELETLFEFFGPEIVIHMAGYPRQSYVDINPQRASDVMVGGTVRLMELSKKHGVRRVIYVSSSMVYGNFNNDANEFFRTNPTGLYGIFKLTGERIVESYANVFEYVILRPSAVYGPRDIKDRVVAKFFLSAIQNQPIIVHGPNEILDFTYVDDAVDGIVLSVSTKNTNRTYNITRSSGRTLLEAAELVKKIVGRGEIQIEQKDMSYPSRGKLCIGRALRELKYHPTVNIEEGFVKTYEWIQNTVH